MNNTNDITRTVIEHWVAVTPGYDCKCGHLHHGRELYRNGMVVAHQAPHYGFCDNEACSCKALQRIL